MGWSDLLVSSGKSACDTGRCWAQLRGGTNVSLDFGRKIQMIPEATMLVAALMANTLLVVDDQFDVTSASCKP